MKLQESYISESNMAGSWELIGYMAPNQSASTDASSSTTNFTYTKGAIAGTEAVSGLNKIGWQAANKPALNDCTANSGCTWTLTLHGESTGNGVQYEAKANGTTSNTNAASQLTPTFAKIGNYSGS